MKLMIKRVGFLIDQRYAEQVKAGKPFHPLLQPSLFWLYAFSVLSRLFTRSELESNPGLSRRSSLMRFLGHSFFPGKLGARLISDQEIPKSQIRFSQVPDAKVTLLILCGDSPSGLIGLLESIKADSESIEVEVVLIARDVDAKMAEFIANNIHGVTVWNTTESRDLLSTLNLAISQSQGTFVSVLSHEVSIQGNWLETMIAEISKYDLVSMVSGKVVSEDGLLDEAGTFVTVDGKLHKYGTADHPDRPKYNFLREIECSTGSNAVFRKTDFEDVGGFDASLTSLSQAFCKLSVAFRKNLGKKVVYTPQAAVIRLRSEKVVEDVSANSDSRESISAIRSSEDDRNARVLLPSTSVLFIDVGLPEHDRDSGSLRAYYLLKLMRELGYHVIMVPRKGQASSPYFEDLISHGVEVLYAFPDRSGMRKELTELLPSVSIAWICRPQLNSEFEWIFRVNPKIKWIFDTVDLHYVRLAREAELTKSKKSMRKSARFKKLELSIASRADLTLTVTDEEKNLLKEQGIRNVEVIPNIHEFHDGSHSTSFAEREGLLFIGSYHHPPNVDAVRWLVEEIMPIVWEKIQIPLTLLGNAPSREVKSLETAWVKVPGYVKDVAPFFASHRLFVAPLRYGAGMKGKIGQSLAYKLPIVTTGIGAEGVGLTDGVDVLIAEDKESFAQHIIHAYEDERLWSSLASNSEKVLERYSPQQIKENLALLLESLR
jgi:hypothetical protein